MTKTDLATIKWWETDWYREWERLSERDYHGKRGGYWHCYYNAKNVLIYEYVDM